MIHNEAFDLIDAGEGRWDIQEHGSVLIAGQVWRTPNGFTLWNWLDQQIGVFDTIEDALRTLLRLQPPSHALAP